MALPTTMDQTQAEETLGIIQNTLKNFSWTQAAVISAMIADECAIGMINNKTTAVRIIPVHGKTVGDEVDFGGLFGTAPIMPVNAGDPTAFVKRGGVIPAPIHANRN